MELKKNLRLSISMTKLSITSLIIIFKGNKSLIEWDNEKYSECILEGNIYLCSFDTHNIEKLEKVTSNTALILEQMGFEDYNVLTVPHNMHQHNNSP